ASSARLGRRWGEQTEYLPGRTPASDRADSPSPPCPGKTRGGRRRDTIRSANPPPRRNNEGTFGLGAWLRLVTLNQHTPPSGPPQEPGKSLHRRGEAEAGPRP